MTATEKIQEILVASATLTALVPAARIRVPGPWQNLARPYIIHFPVSVEPTYTHQALAAGRGWLYQVSIFADSYSTGEAAAVAVRNTLSGVHGDSPLTEGMTIFWEPGSWYVGNEISGNEAGPIVEHFAPEFRIFEGLV